MSTGEAPSGSVPPADALPSGSAAGGTSDHARRTARGVTQAMSRTATAAADASGGVGAGAAGAGAGSGTNPAPASATGSVGAAGDAAGRGAVSMAALRSGGGGDSKEAPADSLALPPTFGSASSADVGRNSSHFEEDEDGDVTPDDVMEFLVEGFVAVKHSRRGAPASRYFYAGRERRLYWNRTAKSRKPRAYPDVDNSVAFDDVQRIIKGRGTATFARTVKFYQGLSKEQSEAKESLCLSLVTPSRTVDLELSSPDQRDELAEDLHLLLCDGRTEPLPLETASLESLAASGRAFPRGGSGLSGLMYRFMYNVFMERFIMGCIIGNIFVMALQSPVETDQTLLDALTSVERVALIIFTAEMVFRVIALEGVSAYLSEAWNALDCIIVLGGWVELLPIGTSFNFSAFRAFRALRVLRTIKFLQGIREVLETFGATLKMVVQAMIVYFYFLFLFAVLGIELFGNALDHRCVPTADVEALRAASAGDLAAVDYSSLRPAEPNLYCSFPETVNISDAVFQQQYWHVGDSQATSHAGCPPSEECVFLDSPNGGMSGFDNLGVSFATVYRISTRPPGNTPIIRGTMQAITNAAVVYFLAIIVFVSFLVLSLFIAIVRGSYGEIERKRKSLPLDPAEAPSSSWEGVADPYGAGDGAGDGAGGGSGAGGSGASGGEGSGGAAGGGGSVGSGAGGVGVGGNRPSQGPLTPGAVTAPSPLLTASGFSLAYHAPPGSVSSAEPADGDRVHIQDVWAQMTMHNKRDRRLNRMDANTGAWMADAHTHRSVAGRSFRSLSTIGGPGVLSGLSRGVHSDSMSGVSAAGTPARRASMHVGGVSAASASGAAAGGRSFGSRSASISAPPSSAPLHAMPGAAGSRPSLVASVRAGVGSGVGSGSVAGTGTGAGAGAGGAAADAAAGGRFVGGAAGGREGGAPHVGDRGDSHGAPVAASGGSGSSGGSGGSGGMDAPMAHEVAQGKMEDEPPVGTAAVAAGTGGNATASAGSGGTGGSAPVTLVPSPAGAPSTARADGARASELRLATHGAGGGDRAGGDRARGPVGGHDGAADGLELMQLALHVDGDAEAEAEGDGDGVGYAGVGLSAGTGEAGADKKENKDPHSLAGIGVPVRVVEGPDSVDGDHIHGHHGMGMEPAAEAKAKAQATCGLSSSRVLFFFPPGGRAVTHVHSVVLHPWFERAVLTAILVNTVLLAMDHHGMSPAYADFLAKAELVFTVGFTAEMLFKIVGLGGVYHYAIANGTQWNRFDGIVVMATLVDLALGQSTGVNLSLLRVFRVFRVVRVLRKNPDLVKLLEAVITSMASLMNLLSFMTLVIIVFAILGMQMFGGTFPADASIVSPRATFDTFGDSMLTLFKLLASGGTWTIFFNALASENGWAAPVYFTAYNVFSTYITLNFLVVIILGKFAMSEDEKLQRRREREKRMMSKQDRLRRLAEPGARDRGLLAVGVGGVPTPMPSPDELRTFEDGAGAATRPSAAADTPHAGHSGRRGEIKGAGGLWRMCPVLRRRWVACGGAHAWARFDAYVGEDKTLLLFDKTNRVRRALTRWVNNPWFERVIICCIVVSSVTLTLESPQYDSEALRTFLLVADSVFLVIFTVEFVVKSVSLGLVFGKDAYVKDAWNNLDLLVLLVTWLGFVTGGSGVGRTLRVGRILRPLRMINRNEGMKVIINALLMSLPAVGYTVVLLLLFFLIFGILGLNLFAGRFFFCNDKTVEVATQCVGTFMAGSPAMAVPRVWGNPPYSFDNIFAAFKTLLEMVALRGWVPVLHSVMDVTTVGHQPQPNASTVNVAYVVTFIFLGSFYMMRLFVGIIVAHFRQFSGTALLTDTQQQWVTMKRVMRHVKPVIAGPNGQFRRGVYEVVSSKWFEPLVTCVILLHLLALSLQFHGQTMEWTEALDTAHYVFSALYSVELVMRVLAYGPLGYIKHDLPWSVYDALAVAGMLLGPSLGFRRGTGVARALRFSRVVRLLAKLQGLSRLIDVLLNSLAAMGNITLLMSLCLFVYAVLGMQFFGTTKYGYALNPNQNFETFPQAILTLFQIVSGENWLDLMRDCAVGEPRCTPGSGTGDDEVLSDCGSPTYGPVFFYSFFILIFAVFLNLYVAAILDTYSSSSVGGDLLTPAKFQSYRQIWQQYDPNGTAYISTAALSVFVSQLYLLGHPLGVNPAQKVHFFKIRMQILASEGIANVGELASTYSLATHDTERATSGGYCCHDKLRKKGNRVGFMTVLQVLAEARVAETALEAHHVAARRAANTDLYMAANALIIARWYKAQRGRRAQLTLLRAAAATLDADKSPGADAAGAEGAAASSGADTAL